MSENKDKKPSNIFSKVLEAGEALLEAQISKAQASIQMNSQLSRQTNEKETSDFNFGKAVTKDRTYSIGAQGYQEKPGAIGFEHLKWMAIKSSVVSAILKTRQNRVAAFAKIADEDSDLGFRIVLKNEEAYLEELRKNIMSGKDKSVKTDDARSADLFAEIKKANVDDSVNDQLDPAQIEALDAKDGDLDKDGQAEDSFDLLSPRDQDRKLREIMKEKTKKKKQAIEEFILSCGETKDRPFETKKWTLETYLRAIVWDSLIYDQIATELVPKEAEIVKDRINIHHFYPVDGSTIRYATQALRTMKNFQPMTGYDILYPEEELKHLEETDALELDQDKLDKDEYKWVQVVRGRIERAFGENELVVGFRNPITDILTNGYPISELELLVALVGSHLQTEYYNRSYFQQGFSAKGILHVKANLNRSKLEELRRHWNHMVSGNRNSFQTPIMSGMDEIQWIPLTQNHNEMEFNLWLNYLIKMICAIYQIDPSEIGYGIKDEGRGSSGMSGDNTQQKLENSKDKGFIPLMSFLANYLNTNIIDNLDPDYKLEWVGLESINPVQKLEIQDKEGRLFKSVNEIREDNGLPPIEGADDLILDNVYFQWFAQFHPDGVKKQQEDMQNQQMMAQQDQGQAQGQDQQDQGPATSEQDYNVQEAQKEADHERDQEAKDKDLERQKELESHKAKLSKTEKVAKSLSIEYYTLEK